MKNDFLHDKFVGALGDKVPNRPQLVRDISDILRIEKEPASRRLNGTVKFSVNEMGELAKELNLSVDALIFGSTQQMLVPFVMASPFDHTIDTLANMVDLYIERNGSICESPSEFTTVFNTLPIEFFMEYENLMKLMFFKWGHFFVGSREFYDYQTWEMPQILKDVPARYRSFYLGSMKIVYIWDDALVWNLCKEILYLCNLRAIDEENKKMICSDLHEMLSNLELFVQGEGPEHSRDPDLTFYISSVSVGATSWHNSSDRGQLAYFQTNFTHTPLLEHVELCKALKKWMVDLQSISTIISGSGRKERRLFFEEQHHIIKHLLE